VLYAQYDLKALRQQGSREGLLLPRKDLWRYAPLLPLSDPAYAACLGEGMSPLIPLVERGPFAGCSDLWVKEESSNPTACFKARGMAVAVSMAAVLGARGVALPSAGNAGSAAAAYAARAGLPCAVAMPADTAPSIVGECAAYGARVVLVRGLITDCGKLISRWAAERGWLDVSTLREPYRVEGKKTLGLELAEQLGWSLPDVVVYPTGGGTGLLGMWKAWEELEQLGWIPEGRRPRLIAVQASGCAPIVRAFREGQPQALPWENASTIALGLRVPRALGDYLILRAVRASRGTAVAVDDDEIRKAQSELAMHQGILASAEGAACWAAVVKLRRGGWLRGTERTVLFNTGAGIKMPELLPSGLPAFDPDDPAALKALGD
jgi:threonine synthase